MLSLMDEQYVQFAANYADWKSVKKLLVEASTQPRVIMQFLASLCIGVDRKVEENLRRTVSLGKVDEALKSVQAGKDASSVANVIAEVNSRKVNSVIKDVCSVVEGVSSPEKKELEEFCKVYALKKALSSAGFFVDYSSINLKVPGMKKKKGK